MSQDPYSPEALKEVEEGMASRILAAVDPLEKEVCFDAAQDNEQRTSLIIVFSLILLDRAIMGLATIGVPWDVIAARVERSYKHAAEVAAKLPINRRGQA